MLSITRYWALWEGGQLLAVTLMRRLQQERRTHGTAPAHDPA